MSQAHVSDMLLMTKQNCKQLLPVVTTTMTSIRHFMLFTTRPPQHNRRHMHTQHKNNVGTCMDRRNTGAIYNNLQPSEFYQQRQENCRLKSTQFKTTACQAQATHQSSGNQRKKSLQLVQRGVICEWGIAAGGIPCDGTR